MSVNSVEYYIWLQSVIGFGSHKSESVLEYFGSPRLLFEAPRNDRVQSGLFTPGELEKFEKITLVNAYAIEKRCAQLGYAILTMEHPDYPLRLKRIADPPLVIYVWGDLSGIDDEPCIAMVGTRSATRYGEEIASTLSRQLAAAGMTIVSGCAKGIDILAHKGALLAGGKTVGVLGCGIDIPYLMENASTREAISKNGAVISEYPPGSPAAPYNFPVRNRLISALSLGTIVVEAGEKSGSLITARLAGEQGKDVFAIPGSLLSKYSAGANRLIKDGAKPISGASDVVLEYIYDYPEKLNVKALKAHFEYNNSVPASDAPEYRVEKPPRELSGISPECKALYDVIPDEPTGIDALSEITKLPTYRLLPILTELEIEGFVRMTAGKRYEKI